MGVYYYFLLPLLFSNFGTSFLNTTVLETLLRSVAKQLFWHETFLRFG